MTTSGLFGISTNVRVLPIGPSATAGSARATSTSTALDPRSVTPDLGPNPEPGKPDEVSLMPLHLPLGDGDKAQLTADQASASLLVLKPALQTPELDAAAAKRAAEAYADNGVTGADASAGAQRNGTVTPPSTTSAWPTTKLDSEEQSQTAASAASPGSPMRPSGDKPA